MHPELVVDRQVALQPKVGYIEVLERHPVGPFPSQGLDKPLVFPVGPGRVGPGANVLEAKGLASLGTAS